MSLSVAQNTNTSYNTFNTRRYSSNNLNKEEKEELLEIFHDHEILKKLEKDLLFKTLDIIEYPSGYLLVTQGEEWNNFCVILDGVLQILVKGKGIVGNLVKGCWFGKFESNAEATVLCLEKTRLVVINYNKLNENIKIQNRNQDYNNKNNDENVNNETQNINFYNKLGSGTFAKVYISKINDDENVYACKYIPKEKIKYHNAQNQINNEINILKELNHDFTIKLIQKMEDNNNLCLVLEHVEGKEFFKYLCQKNTLNEEETKFYISNVIIALEYLHNKDIIYRDLKPENIILSKNGYLKLIDFGFSKKLKKNQLTFTICGTPDYISPEIINGKGYNRSCDYWALGILTYEILNGVCPYNSNCNLYELYNIITNSKINFVRNVSNQLKTFILSLLSINCKNRLGYDNIQDIKNHEIFSKINWGKIEKQEIKAPYLPESVKIDTRCRKSYQDFCSSLS